jgi:hypothetical protein
MKKLILALLPIFLLTGCPKEKEEQEATSIMDELSGKKSDAVLILDSKNWSLDGLLIAHNYFFIFLNGKYNTYICCLSKDC